jgi:predicted metalloendopeptidase
MANKTHRHYKKRSNKNKNKNTTKKAPKNNQKIIIGLKPFEVEFEKTLSRNLTKSNNTIKNEFVKELLSKFTPGHIKPNNDFYDYINYGWLKKVSLEKAQEYIIQVDDFRLTQDKVYRQLNEIILDYIKNNDNKLAKNLKNFYYSIINTNSKEDSRKRSKEIVKKIDELRSNKNNVWKLLAFANKDEVVRPHAPFVWSVNPDNKESSINRCYIDAPSLSIVDINVYFDDGTDIEYKNDVKKEFKKFCKNVFDVTLGPNHHLNPADVFEVEKEMMDALICTKVTTRMESYNKITAHDAITKYDFNWTEFAKDIGFTYTPSFFITSSKNYLKCGTELLLKNWDSEKWRTYWLYIFLKKITRMTGDWEKINYDFFGRFQRGQKRINDSNAVSASLYMSVPFNTFLTNKYVEKYEVPENVKYVEVMCNDLREVFTRIVKRNKWLSPSTKKYAITKLKNLHFDIAKPQVLREDPLLDYGHNVIENMDKIHEWRLNEFINLEGKGLVDIPIMDWTQYPVKMSGTQAYIVNASYTPSKNSIYINLGYIQKPFVDLEERGIEYNLAHLGFTIGHEMGHSLDDWGSQYDYHGNLRDWWTPTDKKKFKQIQNDVIKQYEEFAARDGINFDASIGVGEDLADIAGLAVCDEYLRDYQAKNEDIIPIKNISFEAFYTYYAFQQKQHVGKKALAAQLKSNPHPLDKYRCNIPLSRSQIFRALYNVKKGDGMWWHNTNTVW